ncbi:uncharacterized protein LOC120013607 [Tripterygium wilfordii]|uniref:uncharacterized protein LOC120013607 n=1 Tax=Tripterygium wilfordii TaxID=458696 RepID=UPI0018F80A76|nr:uncharacterized protein LOC120013607 [Tripterygium wilfordii]
MPTMTYVAPFQLLELNIISAQDLAPVSRNMKTYAVAWVRPDRKLSTRVDSAGRKNPTWNDKFVFRVDDEFLCSDTSAVMIEIYAVHWFRNVHVGTVRVIVGNLFPPPTRPTHRRRHHPQVGMRFEALQVRRPSGRPQGILNIGVALLDSSRRSMPLYTQLDASAVDYRHLMGEDDPVHSHQHGTQNNASQTSHDQNNAHQNMLWSLISKPELRRTKSDTSSMMDSSVVVTIQAKAIANKGKASSMVSGSEPEFDMKQRKSKKGKASSMVSGSETELDMKQRKTKKGNSKSSSVISVSDGGKKAKMGKPDSVLKALQPAATPIKRQKSVRIADSEPYPSVNGSHPTDPVQKFSSGNPIPKPPGFAVKMSPKINRLNSRSPHKPFPKIQDPEHELTKKRIMGRPFLTESELGPSPSEVASALAKDQQNRIDRVESSLLSESELESSVEGLQSKLERWRAELPPVYDTGELSSVPASTRTSHGKHNRRRTVDGGLFSCFSNICGIECSIVCGSGGSGSTKKKSGRLRRSASVEDVSFV